MKVKINNKEFTFRSYKKGDEKKIVDLLNENLDLNLTIDYWKWKYLENPSGSINMVIIDSKTNIVGHVGNQLKLGLYKNKTYPYLLTMDVCIKKDFRGLGLLRKLPLFYPKTKFVHYGTPNENALNAY